MNSWQYHSDLTKLAGYAPREQAHPEHNHVVPFFQMVEMLGSFTPTRHQSGPRDVHLQLGQDITVCTADQTNIFLSVDLSSPNLAVSRRWTGNALTPADHAPLRLTLQHGFRSGRLSDPPRRLDRVCVAAATTDLHYAQTSH